MRHIAIPSVKTGLLAFALAFAGGALVAAQQGGPAPAPAAAANADAAAAAGESALVDERTIDLGAAYPEDGAAAGKTFRARKISLAPGARAADLAGRPAIYYVTAGEIVERSNGAAAKRALHQAGAIGKDAAIVLENASDAPAEILLVDIVSGS
jgi:hypothetical protein